MPSAAVSSVVQYGRRKGSSKQALSSEMQRNEKDLRQVVVLSKSEWQRLQDRANGLNQQHRSAVAVAEQREALHMRSKELVKHWSNTIAGQRQKKLEAKKIREAIEEEERKRIDLEEAKYQTKMRKEAIEKASALQYYQTDRVKGFHSALLLVEVLKEREAQIELKRLKQNATKEINREVLAEIASREEKAVEEEKLKDLQMKQEQMAIADILKQQIMDQDLKKKQEMQELKQEAEENKRLKNLYLWEQSMKERKHQEEKKSLMKANFEHMTHLDMMKAAEAQSQEEEEVKRKELANHKEKMMKMRKEKQEDIFREQQRHREKMTQKLAVLKQQELCNEEEIITKALAEQEAKWIREQREKEEKHKVLMTSITAHRQAMKKDLDRKAEEEKEEALETLITKKEADQIFLEKQQLKAQKAREEGRALQDIYVQEMAVKCSMNQHEKKKQQDFVKKNTALIFEEEKQFQKYAREVMQTAEKAGRNTFPLVRAARDGIGGGMGPVFGGLRPSYLVHDETGVQMPSFLRATTQSIKELNETSDLQRSKKRLGFTCM